MRHQLEHFKARCETLQHRLNDKEIKHSTKAKIVAGTMHNLVMESLVNQRHAEKDWMSQQKRAIFR